MNFVNYGSYAKSVNNYPNMFFSLNRNNREYAVPLPTPIFETMNKNIQYPVNKYTAPQPNTPQETPKKIKWGYPTWLLFHTMSVKIRDDVFENVITNVLNIIYTICVNLPCPDCANHAKSYLDSINFRTIRTKYDLQKMLFDFHNSVNVRKGYPIFKFENLEETYSKAITRNVIINFIEHFRDKSHSIKMIANDFHRTRLVNELTDWFNQNITIFLP
jgi:hypothetical protein